VTKNYNFKDFSAKNNRIAIMNSNEINTTSYAEKKNHMKTAGNNPREFKELAENYSPGIIVADHTLASLFDL
jgi:hypothetical protein